MLLRPWIFLFSLVTLLFPPALSAQTRAISSGEIKQRLERLNVLGSVLYFAAHPDDENTLLLSWLTNEKHYRTAYLSLTRGDGGQNLIGTEQGVELGMIRTQEMLAARAIDGGEQFFSAAYDFGFSKTYDETFRFWNKEETLREAVYLIRKFQPDVIINRFPPDKRGGHGHHQASALLSREAFQAAADPKKFPEQLKEVSIWQTKRLLWNTANFGGQNNTSEDQLKIEVGHYSPLLGLSYGEMAARSRSMHKSQGFGAASRRGQLTEYFEHVAGEEATETLMDGVATDWSRISGSGKIAEKIDALNAQYEPSSPQRSLPGLKELHILIKEIQDPYWREQKLKEVEALIIACAGLHIESYTDRTSVTVGEPLEIKHEIVVRNPDAAVVVWDIDGNKVGHLLNPNKISRHTYTTHFDKITQPYWLEREKTAGKFDVRDEDFGHPINRDLPQTSINISVIGLPIQIELPIKHRFVDPVRGEVHDDIRITPLFTGNIPQDFLLATDSSPLSFSVAFEGTTQKGNHQVQVEFPKHLNVTPSSFSLDFAKNSTITKEFQVAHNREWNGAAEITFKSSGVPILQKRTIRYDHIPTLSWFPPMRLRIQPLAATSSVKRIAYVHGAGDKIPEALRAVGIQVDLLSPNQLSATRLQQYDALVFGVRAFNVHQTLAQKMDDVLRYANDGGVVIVQYNVSMGLSPSGLGPYPFQLGRSRVTEEDAEVRLQHDDPALQFPNKITETDFEGWVQERGLYFVENADKKYRQPLAMSDQGEAPHTGSLLIAKHGSGKFVYTSLSFFRQLPAGVPGAYRLFLNLLNKEQ